MEISIYVFISDGIQIQRVQRKDTFKKGERSADSGRHRAPRCDSLKSKVTGRTQGREGKSLVTEMLRIRNNKID